MTTKLTVLQQLEEIFDSLPPSPSPSINSSTSNSSNSRTAPLHLLPSLISTFESKRNITLLTNEERESLELFINSQGLNSNDGEANGGEGGGEVLVGSEDVLRILVSMGVSGNSPVKNSTTSTPSTEEELKFEEGGVGDKMDLPSKDSINLDGSPIRKSSRPSTSRTSSDSLIPLFINPNSAVMVESNQNTPTKRNSLNRFNLDEESDDDSHSSASVQAASSIGDSIESLKSITQVENEGGAKVIDNTLNDSEDEAFEDKQRTIRISSSASFRSSLPIPIKDATLMNRSISQPIPETQTQISTFGTSTPTTITGTPRSTSIDSTNSHSIIQTPLNITGIPRPSFNSTSSLSFRQRSSPLESFTPDSSSFKLGNQSKLSSLSNTSGSSGRSKPIAPAKLRRTSTNTTATGSNSNMSCDENVNGLTRSYSAGGSSNSSGNEEPLSPTTSEGRSSFDQFASRRTSNNFMISNNNNGSFSRSESMNSELSTTSSTSATSGTSGSVGAGGNGGGGRRSSISSIGSVPSSPHSPPTSLDFTSYYNNRPISPMGDVGSSTYSPSISNNLNSMAFDLNLHPASPLDSSNINYNLEGQKIYFSNSNQSSPEKSAAEDNDNDDFRLMRREISNSSSNSSNNGDRNSTFLGEGLGINGNVRPESIFNNSRPSSILGGDNQVQLLLAQAQELSKRLKEAEGRLQSTSSSYEQDHIDLENRLEEARLELQIKRREEKELKVTEKQHLAQIGSLENDITKLTTNLEKSKEQYESMKRSYSEQCNEAEKLRGIVSEVRMENRAAEESASHHDHQVQQFERDREALQIAINKLEEDLIIARRAQDQLDDHKAENLLLNETIDRLKFDMEELRSSSRKSLLFDESGNSTSSVHSNDGSIGGNLGNELARRLAQTESEELKNEDSEGEEGDEEEEETTVTTHRIIKKKVARNGSTRPGVNLVQEKTTIVSDANIQTDSVLTTEMDVQTDLIAITSDLNLPPPVVVVEEEIEEIITKSEKELQEELAKGLGIDMKRLNQFILLDKVPLAGGKPILVESISSAGLASRRANRWSSRISSRMPNPALAPAYFVNAFPISAKPYVVQFLDSTTSFVLYSLVMYMSGVITGPMFVPSNSHHTLAPFHVLIGSSDQVSWNQYNNLAGAFGEGLASQTSGGSIASSIRWWLTELVWGGVSIVRRVPT